MPAPRIRSEALSAWASTLLLLGACGGDDASGTIAPVDVAGGVDAVVDADAVVDVDVDAIAVGDTGADTGTATEPDALPDVAPDVVPDVAPDVAADVPLTGCFTEATAGHHHVACGEITYEVEVPEACVTSACGLIVDIHGWTMTADLEDLNTDMRQRGRDAGFVVIQPTAPLFVGVPTWDLNRHAEMIFAFTAEVAERLGTDPNRAFAMGFSQGGGLTWELVCKHADFFAAGAPIGALPGCTFKPQDRPSREVHMMLVHGRKDAVVAFSELEGQRDLALDYWPFGAPSVIEDDGAHKVTRWSTPSGTVLEVWEHDYTATSAILKGHCLPGSPDVDRLPLAFGCQDANTFVYAANALAFFQAHGR